MILRFQSPKRKKIKTAVIAKNAKNIIRMLNQTKMTERSSATNVELDGKTPSYLLSLESEVQEIADGMSVEIILFLIEKWERDIFQKQINGKLTMEERLGHN